MRPLALLLGIAMGSAVSLTAGLALTLAVFLLMPEHRDRLAVEEGALVAGLCWAVVLALCASAGFVGELRRTAWRRPAQLAMLVVLLGMAWHFWPSRAA